MDQKDLEKEIITQSWLWPIAYLNKFRHISTFSQSKNKHWGFRYKWGLNTYKAELVIVKGDYIGFNLSAEKPQRLSRL